MDDNTILIADENGVEKEFEILFTFESENKSYVLYYDPTEDEPNVYASIYDDEGHLFDVETPEEWDLISEVFETFMGNEDEEEAEEEEKDHECCCGKHHGENHECCGKHQHNGDGCCCEENDA